MIIKMPKIEMRRTVEGLERYQEGALLSKPSICSKIFCSELINRYHDNPLASHFGIEKS